MYAVSAAGARKDFSNVIDRAEAEAVAIERRGQRAAVVVSAPPKGREWAVQPTRYVQFLPVSDDRVSAPGRPVRSEYATHAME